MTDHSVAGVSRRFADDTDLEEVYNTERHLLYVAWHSCSRSSARDETSAPASEFLDDCGYEDFWELQCFGSPNDSLNTFIKPKLLCKARNLYASQKLRSLTSMT